MPATEPDQIPRVFEAAFNAADLEGLLVIDNAWGDPAATA